MQQCREPLEEDGADSNSALVILNWNTKNNTKVDKMIGDSYRVSRETTPQSKTRMSPENTKNQGTAVGNSSMCSTQNLDQSGDLQNEYLINSYRKINPLHLLEDGLSVDVGHMVLE